MGESVEVRNNAESRLYEATVGGQVVGTISYQLFPGRIALVHSFVEPRLRGQGIASTLTRLTLDDIRSLGLTVTPLCEFIAEFINRNPDYADLTDPRLPNTLDR